MLKRSSATAKKATQPTSDDLYGYDKESQKEVLAARPWKKDPHYFTTVKISGLAVLKMVMHTISGVPLEVMGILQGKVDGRSFIVTDVFALPVKGTETRVDAMDEALGYMSEYTNLVNKVGRVENVVGWYHSHPGYGCWLSGIDTNTQMQQQKFLDPFLAIVVDPVRTISSGKVEIGAFRTYPEGYKPPSSQESEYQSIPLDKIEDFGVYADMYYKLDLKIYKSSTDTSLLDLLWSKYWVNTLSSSPLVTNRDYTNQQMLDLAEKIDKAENEIASAKMSYFMPEREGKQKKESPLSKINKDSTKISVEVLHGIISQVTKDAIFNVKDL